MVWNDNIFISFIQRSKSDSRNISYRLLLVQRSKKDSRIIIIHSIIHSRIIIIHSTVMLLIREQQSLNRIFIIIRTFLQSALTVKIVLVALAIG